MVQARQKRKTAVALKYSPEKKGAPRVVAKGQGVVAEKILEAALKNGITIHEDPDLVEVLSKLDVHQEIPPELYKVVAELLLFIYRLNNRTVPLKKK